MFVKTAFQVVKPKFLACSMKEAFYLLHKLLFNKLSVRYLVVKPACVNAA